MSTEPGRRLAALDALRLFAALAVGLFHLTAIWALDGHRPASDLLPELSRYAVYGILGVQLFFMISGFVICMSGWGRSLGEFFASRAARLYPTYWACVVVSAIVIVLLPVSGIMPFAPPVTLGGVAINLTMLQEPLGAPSVDPVYWTLWVELRFYLLFAAFVVVPGTTYRRTVIFCVTWLTAATITPAVNSPLFSLVTLGAAAPYFVAGVTMFLMRRYGSSPLLWAIIAFSWLINMYHLSLGPVVQPGWEVAIWPALLIVTLAYGVLLLIALGYTDWLTWRWLTVAGALTFPFYLLHRRVGYVLVQYGYLHSGLPAVVVVFGAIAVLLGVSWLVYRLVEVPFSPRLRDAVRRGLAAARSAAPVPAPAPRPASPDRHSESVLWPGKEAAGVASNATSPNPPLLDR
ncbi:acyltransferase family protein [Actinoplanes sp. NPDC051859]|uniref:acyltransferase family protein n=1 Tax=Actinoplanes sp. NPDC051859 TaxID=3363909 RepID=UPI0037A373CE